MYTDNFYQLVSATSLSWFFLALLYAVFNYVYDVGGCWVFGGIAQLRQEKITVNFSTLTHNRRDAFKVFNEGGQTRLSEFRADVLSWLWPITVLAIPTFIYGLSQQVVIRTVEELAIEGISLENYRSTISFFDWSANIQFVVWLLAILMSFFTFWNYRSRPLNVRTWFAKSDGFHVSRILLFNSILTYMVLTTIIVWVDFMLALYRTLGDDTLKYNVLHQDLMYGLRTAYDTVIILCLAFLIISLLPLIMLIREKGQRFSRGYHLLFYLGIFFVILPGVFVVSQFHLRLGAVQELALHQIVNTVGLGISNNSIPSQTTLEGLWFYEIVSGLPGGFPVPRWLEFLVTARFILIPYEIYLLFSTGGEKASPSEILRRVIETVS